MDHTSFTRIFYPVYLFDYVTWGGNARYVAIALLETVDPIAEESPVRDDSKRNIIMYWGYVMCEVILI